MNKEYYIIGSAVLISLIVIALTWPHIMEVGWALLESFGWQI